MIYRSWGAGLFRRTLSHFGIVKIWGLLFAFHPAIASDNWPKIEFPPNTQVTTVAEDMELNGVKMKSWSFSTWGDRSTAMNFYRKMWQETAQQDMPGFVEYEVGGWLVISRLEGDYQITVQFGKAEKGHARGLVGVSQLPKFSGDKSLASNFPRFGNMRIINEIDAVDINRRSKTIVAITDASVKHSVKLLRSEFLRKGWEEKTASLKPIEGNQFAMMFHRRSSELNIAVVKDGSVTGIVAIFIDF